MTDGDLSLIVCVSSDPGLRERVVRRADGLAPVLVCADLSELRTMLFERLPTQPPPPRATPGVSDLVPVSPAGDPPPGPGIGSPPRVVSLGDLVVDTVGHVVTWRGGALATTHRERELLVRLVRQPIAVWPYDRLFAEVWGGAYLGDTSILHSAVKRLRRKLRTVDGGPIVETVRGVGYRLTSVA